MANSSKQARLQGIEVVLTLHKQTGINDVDRLVRDADVVAKYIEDNTIPE